MSFGNFRQDRQPDAYAAAAAFACEPARSWLVLEGAVGTGKTHLLAAIVNRLLTSAWHPVYAVMPDLLRHLREGFDSGDHAQRWRDVKEAEVLLLDDYGAEQQTDWGNETLFVLLDYRWAMALPTVVATNLKPADMPPRIASRLHDLARSRVVRMRGGDYRRAAERAGERAGAS
jgi:DNA replication protein DnaC